MIRKILVTGAALAAAYVVVSALPDLARYLRIRQM
jgi:uncharacterized protein DUF6893